MTLILQKTKQKQKQKLKLREVTYKGWPVISICLAPKSMFFPQLLPNTCSSGKTNQMLQFGAEEGLLQDYARRMGGLCRKKP